MMKRWIAALLLACLAGFATPVAAQTFSNPAAIHIPDQGYTDSVIHVSGLSGQLASLSLTLDGVSHTFANDLVFGLVAENSAIGFIFWSGVGGGQPVSNLTLTFTDLASAFLPASLPNGQPVAAGSYLPSNYAGYGIGGISNAVYFSDFNGIDPNGDWRLLAYDLGAGDVGGVTGGWSLTMTTKGNVAGGVPEPGTWAMLIGGFALAGATLRRQHRAPAAA